MPGGTAGDLAAMADLAQLASQSGTTAGRRNSTSLTNSSVVAVPSPDALTHAIAQRYRVDLNATYLGHSNLIVVNPLEPKSDTSEASKAEYEDRVCRIGHEDVSNADVNPHAYDLACRVYWAARRSGRSQSIVYR